MLFCEKLKLFRKENGFTQEELADKLNVSRQAITKWECNEGMPDIENLKQISELFGVSIDELIKENIDVDIESKKKYSYVWELDIDHTKHFDINICNIYELNIKPSDLEKVKVEILSNEEDVENIFRVKFDDLYNNLDIDIKSKSLVSDACINLYLPEKYINDIELKSKMKCLNIYDLEISKLEYDGELKYLNVLGMKGNVVLNTSKCDVEVSYDKFDGRLEVNIINSVARVKIPKETSYRTVLKGIKNEFVDAINTEEALNVIELNGLNSKLIVIQE